MLKYKLLEKVGKEFIYAYYPEGKETSAGIVGISESGNKRLISESEADFGGRYAYHAMSGINTDKESGTVAWY
ncbi:MAG: hypothetical protein HFE64_03375 [Lachnospiraceae bacterium]|jgi:hypothetical protein|nr:hypothetical protein [Lachnospiraceae bacterium]